MNFRQIQYFIICWSRILKEVLLLAYNIANIYSIIYHWLTCWVAIRHYKQGFLLLTEGKPTLEMLSVFVALSKLTERVSDRI